MNSLNFLREKPAENWIDYFVDSEKFSALLNAKGRFSDIIVKFSPIVQFSFNLL